MSQTIVVVTFYSRRGETERLATAAAVGAVQSRAGIRMRRLPDADNGAADPDEASDVARMRAEYIAPREADVLAADALVVGLPPELGPSSPECAAFFELLAKLRAGGKLGGKVAAAVGTGPVVDAVNRALTSAGLSVIRPEAPAIAVESCIALGRRVVAEAESVKRRAGT